MASNLEVMASVDMGKLSLFGQESAGVVSLSFKAASQVKAFIGAIAIGDMVKSTLGPKGETSNRPVFVQQPFQSN